MESFELVRRRFAARVSSKMVRDGRAANAQARPGCGRIGRPGKPLL
ncbi:hypothetical protein [Caballeronia arvi]|nr:hypothetical protein [Caballeronia arvi]